MTQDWAARALAESRTSLVDSADTVHVSEPGDARQWHALAAGARAAMPASPPPREEPPDPASPWSLTVDQLLATYASHTLDPPSVVAALLARAGPDGPAPEAALRPIPGAAALAGESALRLRRGTARPLEGVPFAVKDIIDVAGTSVTCGSHQTGARQAQADADCVARLKAAGAIPLLMLATSEFAYGDPHNARHGAVPNPWDRSRWAGGSSTGAGAALAARLVPLALGTDSGGSIRIPAALCGVTGLKPTRGLVSRAGVATLSWTLDHVGPMARTCADVARVLPVLAGAEGECAPSSGIAGLRIGAPDGWFLERCDAHVLAAFSAGLAELEAAGAKLRPIRLPAPDVAIAEGWAILLAELASSQEPRLGRMELFDAGTRERIDRGRHVLATDYLRALRRRPLVQQSMLDAMEPVDLLAMPGVGAEAPYLADSTATVDGVRYPMYEITPRNTMIFNLTGFPALMLPMGAGASGLPVAMQIVARPFADALCLRAGMAFQARTRHHLANHARAGSPWRPPA